MPRESLAWLLPFFVLVTAVVAVPLRIFEEQGLPRYQRLKAELAEVQERNAEISSEVHDLRERVDSLRSDPETIERVARDELGMVRDDEFVFQF